MPARVTLGRPRDHRLALAALAALAIPAACGGDVDGPATFVRQKAAFQDVHWEVLPPTTGEPPRREVFHVSADSAVSYISSIDGQPDPADDYRGRLFAADVEALAALAASAAVVDGLLDSECVDRSPNLERVVIGIGSNLKVVGQNTFSEGAVANLGRNVRHLVARSLPHMGIVDPGPSSALPSLAGAVVDRPVAFSGFMLSRGTGPCPVPGVPRFPSLCVAQQSLEVRLEPSGRAWVEVRDLGGSSKQWTDVDISSLAEVAMRGRVIEALRGTRDGGCAENFAPHESMDLWITRGLVVRANTSGCTGGPIADLRAAADALVSRLRGTPPFNPAAVSLRTGYCVTNRE